MHFASSSCNIIDSLCETIDVFDYISDDRLHADTTKDELVAFIPRIRSQEGNKSWNAIASGFILALVSEKKNRVRTKVIIFYLIDCWGLNNEKVDEFCGFKKYS